MSTTEPASVTRREVSWPRILVALCIALACAWLGRFLPLPDGKDYGPACSLLFVTALTTSCWLLAAMPIAAASNTIVFSSRLVTFGQMARAGIWLDILAAILLVPVMWWWAFPMLGVDPSTLRGGG